jgi:hypothetical protein
LFGWNAIPSTGASSHKQVEAIDRRLHLLKFHFPYHESDHVLTFAYNALCDGTCLQDLELRRQDEVFLDALGARRLPDPTTAGDFCRRFAEDSIRLLQDIVHGVRLGVWAEQPADFFDRAIIDMDGFLVETTGQCKQRMDIAYDGTWGYHALVLSLANTGEVLGLVNRAGNRPSREGAAAEVDRALAVCFRGGFRQVLLRGDTDFSQTEHLDRWDADPRVRFVFGYDAAPNLVARAEELPARAWKPLHRPPHHQVRTRPRQRPDNVKEAVVVRRGFDNLKLRSEDLAEFNYLDQLATLRDQLKIGLSGVEAKEGEPTVAQLAERIKQLRAANTIEAAPQRAAKRQASAEEPVTARILRRSEEGQTETRHVDMLARERKVANGRG